MVRVLEGVAGLQRIVERRDRCSSVLYSIFNLNYLLLSQI